MKAHPHRLLRSDEQALLQAGWQALEPFVVDFSDERRRRRYFHLYQKPRSTDVLSAALHQRIMDFGTRLGAELLAAELVEVGDEVTHYGYLVNAPGAPAQDWHVDYDGDMVSIYIPLTRETERNATQYLQRGDGCCQSVQFINQADDDRLIIYNPRRSVHRGIENSEWFTRTVFYFYIARPDWHSHEPLFARADRLAVNVDSLERQQRHRTEAEEKSV